MAKPVTKQATYYLAGRCFQGDADLYIFTCWNAEHTSCGCHSVYGSELGTNIAALERMGYAVENLDAAERAVA